MLKYIFKNELLANLIQNEIKNACLFLTWNGFDYNHFSVFGTKILLYIYFDYRK